LSEPIADDVRAAGTGWFAALMLLLVISLVAVSVVTAIKCRIGAIYPGIAAHAFLTVYSNSTPDMNIQHFLPHTCVQAITELSRLSD